MYYYLVAPTILVRKDQDSFTYHSPHQLPIGTVVTISIGKKTAIGVIMAFVRQKPTFATKMLGETLVSTSLPKPLIELALWMSKYYASPLSTVLQAILPAGLNKKRRQLKHLPEGVVRNRTNIVLNDDQQAALKKIAAQKPGTILLHGVTGSGKTQLYIELAKQSMADNKSIIVLVPEISLTPQLVAEFQHHFPRVIVTHSKLTEAERHILWLECLTAAQPIIVIGPRSALFMPLHDLGLIVVDEAHEATYKQDQTPRYSALRLATMLARYHNIRAVFGTATPAIADYFLASQHQNAIIELPRPARKVQSPQVHIVDLKNKQQFREHRFISDMLLTTIRDGIANNTQTLIFHNRRGSAPTALCQDCGWSADCPGCFVPLTFHADNHQLLCHICGHKQSAYPVCPACNAPDIVFKGIGTKLIQQEVQKLFPKATIARFDTDSTKEETLYNRYQELYDGGIDIIIGTQLLAKGLDLPNLTAVGIIQADSGLQLPDYQTEERVFQLLYQAAGRVGRLDTPSTVVVQTYTPQSPLIQQALTKDYNSFYTQQLKLRQTAKFPPYFYLLKLTCSYKTESGAINAAKKLATHITQQWPSVIVAGPVPAFRERMGGNYRWQIVIKAKNRTILLDIAKEAPAGWQVDVDPGNLL
jgi:primosomal protein N' (replication factor Y)